MICRHCRKKLDAKDTKCRHCGQPVSDNGSGVFQTSAVLIAAEGTEMVYRSMEEVPDPLRTKLLKSTNSPNSATILIADRRGRKEIAKVMRSLPGAGSRGVLHSLLSGESSPGAPPWLTPKRKKLLLVVIVLLVLAFVAVAFHPAWLAGKLFGPPALF